MKTAPAVALGLFLTAAVAAGPTKEQHRQLAPVARPARHRRRARRLTRRSPGTTRQRQMEDRHPGRGPPRPSSGATRSSSSPPRHRQGRRRRRHPKVRSEIGEKRPRRPTPTTVRRDECRPQDGRGPPEEGGRDTGAARGPHPTHTYAAGSPCTDGKNLYVPSRLVRRLLLRPGRRIENGSTTVGRLQTRLGWGEAARRCWPATCWSGTGPGGRLVHLRPGQEDRRREMEDRRRRSHHLDTPLVVEHKGRTQVIVKRHQDDARYDAADASRSGSAGGQTVNCIRRRWPGTASSTASAATRAAVRPRFRWTPRAT